MTRMFDLSHLSGIPNMVVIGSKSHSALMKVRHLLNAHGVRYFPWSDPDESDEFLAIATTPLGDDQRAILANFT